MRIEIEQLKDYNLDLKEELTELKQAYMLIKEERDKLKSQVTDYKIKFRSFNEHVKDKVQKALKTNSVDL